MFAKQIIDSDNFLDMPLSTQALYFHLSMRADDDGFINNPKKIMRMIGAADDDMRILVARQYVLAFETGVVVVRHWKIHNYIQKDRYKETTCLTEKDRIETLPDGSYTECIQNVSEMDTQVRLEIGKDRLKIENERAKPEKHRYGENGRVLLTDDEYKKLQEQFPDADAKINRLDWYIASKGDKYRSHYATILNWARMDAERNPGKRQGTTPDTERMREAIRRAEERAAI